jgi:hypothetical protein
MSFWEIKKPNFNGMAHEYSPILVQDEIVALKLNLSHRNKFKTSIKRI